MKQKQKTGSRVLFAATQSGLYRSLDFGETWTAITSGIIIPSGAANGGGCRLGVTPADTNIVYLAMNDKGGSIFKSTDGGTNFVINKNNLSPYLTGYSNNTADPGQGNYNLGFGVDRTNANTIYFVAHNVWKSTDGGVTWTQLTVWYQKVHTDMHEIFTSPYDNSKLYNMNDGGVWLSTDGGNNWTPKSDGIYGYENYHGTCSPTLKDMISVGTQDNGELYANSTGWFTNRGGDWQSNCVFDYRPNSSMVYYFKPDWGAVNTPKRRLVNGSSASYGLPAIVEDITGIAFNRSNTNLAFAADTLIYKTTTLLNTTPAWTSILNTGKKVMAVHSSVANANNLYVITNDATIYVSTNALSATPTFTSYTLPNTTNTVATITTISNNSNIVYATLNTKVFRSSDNGATWTNISYNLPSVNHVNIISDEYFATNELVFIASNNAVYYKTVNATTWTIYNTGLPTRTSIVDMSIFNDGTANTSLRITTYGRGVWQTPIANLRTLTANFAANNTTPCIGNPVTFSDLSVGNVTSRNWSFPGGTPSSSTALSPVVTYAAPGTYNVTLQVGDGTTTNSVTQNAYISTLGGSLPVAEGFEGVTDPPSGWKNIDNGTSGYAWAKTTTAGGFGLSPSSMVFDNYSWNVVGQRDELQVKRLNFTGLNAAALNFDVAYMSYTGYSDSLIVRISTDCGLTYTRLYAKGSAQLTTAGSGTANFVPTSSQWRTESINLNAYTNQASVILEFQNVNGYGNKLYIDNININGTYSITASAGANGAISPSGITSVASGGSQTYNISPNACYQISNVTVNGVAQGAISTYTFNNVTSSNTINATFSPITYTITSGAGPNGSISPLGTNVVNCGSNLTFNMTPSLNYSVADVIVDGVSQGAISSYTFTNVTSNRNIQVTFVVNCTPLTWYQDADNDGFGNNAVTTSSCNPLAGYVSNNTDCNDNNAAVNTPQLYYVDADGDGFGSTATAMLCNSSAPAGYSSNNTDCNDNNASVNTPQLYYVDADGDGFGSTTTAMLCNSSAPAGYSSNNTDCDDNNASVNTPQLYYVDADGDGFGSITTAMLCNSSAPMGYSSNNTDCNDQSALTNPGANEICGNGIDENCNGQIDEGCCNMSLSTTVQQITCNGLNNGAITVNVFNSNGLLSYNWSNGGGTATISGLSPGTYTVTVKDAFGCLQTTSVTITEPIALILTASSTNASCGANNGSLTSSASGGTGALAYNWSNGASSANVANIGVGSYTVTVTDANGCSAQSNVTINNVGTPFGAVVIAGPSGACKGQTGVVFSTNAVAGATYTWTLPTGATGTSTSNSITVAFSSTLYNGGAICLTVSNACNTLNACNVLSVYTAIPAVPGNISGPALSVCAGSTQTYSIAPVANATSYTWTAPTNATITAGQGTTTATFSFNASFSSGTVSVKSVNCKGSSAAKTLAVYNIPARPTAITGITSAACGGSTQNYSSTAMPGATGYTWTVPAGCVILSGQGTNAISVSFPTNYTTGSIGVFAYSLCGNSLVRSVTVISKPATPGTITGPVSNLCGTGSYNYSIVPVTGATSYTWSVPAGCSITVNNGTSITMSYTPAFVSGNICVFASNICGNSATKCLALSPKPPVPVSITGPVNVCSGQLNAMYTTPQIAGFTISWFVSAGVTIVSGQGNDTLIVNWGTANGTISAKNNNACGISGVKNLSVNVVACRESGEPQVVEESSFVLEQTTAIFNLKPNPANDEANVTFSTKENEVYTLELTDITGKLIYREIYVAKDNADQNVLIDLRELSNGMYFVNLVDAINNRQTIKLIKN